MDVLDSFRLDDRVAVVTGGTRGIGRGIASALGSAGATLVLVGRDAGAGRRAVEELGTDGCARSSWWPTSPRPAGCVPWLSCCWT